MYRINQQRQRTSKLSPNRYNTDTYIIQYKQSKAKINNRKPVQTLPVSPFELLKGQEQKNYRKKQSTIRQREQYTQKYVDHRKNIDRLMDVLKSKSKSQDQGSSAIHKIVKIIDKIYQRYWRIYERIMKRKGFETIYKTSVKLLKPIPLSQPLFLKDSLEFQENEIQKFSKNFQLQDLIQIVDLHLQQNQESNPALENSLSRQLNHQENIQRKSSQSPRKISQNVYIMKKSTKQELQTRPQLSNFITQKHISSIQNIHINTNVVQTITPSKIQGKSLQKKIQLKEKSLKTKQKYSVINQISLQELSIDSFIKAKPSQILGQGIEIQKQLSKIKLPIIRKNQIQVKRTNRLMNPQNKGRKIIFHYKNSNQKSPNRNDNYYVGGGFNENHRLQHKNRLADTRMQTNSTNQSLPFQNNQQRFQFETQQMRIQRSTSMQVISPKMVFNHEADSNKVAIVNQQSEELTKDKKRCSSMPKITFTYKIKEEIINFPEKRQKKFQKSSPILLLNERKGIKITNQYLAKRQDPYFPKNIQIKNVCTNSREAKKIINCIYSQKLYNQPSFEPNFHQNDYKIPVQNYIFANKPENLQHVLQKTNQQTLYNNLEFDKNIKADQIRQNEYYYSQENNIGYKNSIQARPFIQNAQRNRVRSTDAYILTKRIDTKPIIIPQQRKEEIKNSMQRNRIKSCGTKLQLVSRMPHLIQAY